MPDAPRPSELPVLAAAGHHDAHKAHFSAVASLVTAAENRHKYDCLTFSLSLHKRLQDIILLPTCEAVQLVLRTYGARKRPKVSLVFQTAYSPYNPRFYLP